MENRSVDPELYTEEYFLNRCGGVEFYRLYGHKVLKPIMQAAVLAADLRPGQRLIDVGCGRGELSAHLHEKGFDVTGVDYSRESIEFAKRAYPPGRFQVVNASTLGFPAESFDRVFFLGIIEHLYDEEIRRALGEMLRILKPGGLLVITTCTNRLYYKTNTYRLRLGLVRLLNRCGFSLKEPSAPRSDEDERLHVNELHYYSLRKLLSELGAGFRIELCPNPKLDAARLYGHPLPEGFPLRPSPLWRQKLYRLMFFRFPLDMVLARACLAVVRKPSGPREPFMGAR